MKRSGAAFCPLLKKGCIEHGCKFYIHVIGNNPQTGRTEDKWDCTFAWLPILLIENSQMQRQTGAAVESFRNEVVDAAAQLANRLALLPRKEKEIAIPP